MTPPYCCCVQLDWAKAGAASAIASAAQTAAVLGVGGHSSVLLPGWCQRIARTPAGFVAMWFPFDVGREGASTFNPPSAGWQHHKATPSSANVEVLYPMFAFCPISVKLSYQARMKGTHRRGL